MPTQIETRIKNVQKILKVTQTGIFDMESCLKFEQVASIAAPTPNTLDAHKKAIQYFLGFRGGDVDAIYGGNTLTRLEDFLSKELPVIPAGASMVVSKASLELIINQEVSSRAMYNKKYKFPTWPGGQSGVTIGIGYDIGTGSANQFTADWKSRIPIAKDFTLLAACANKTGSQGAAALTNTVKQIIIPLDTALDVFYTVSMPKYAKDVKGIYPGVEKLPPDAQGALLSLVYNRGASLKNIDSRKEMRNIVPLVAAGNLSGIAKEIRNMKRLWVGQNLQGLLDRRDAEAAFVENATFNILPADCVVV